MKLKITLLAFISILISGKMLAQHGKTNFTASAGLAQGITDLKTNNPGTLLGLGMEMNAFRPISFGFGLQSASFSGKLNSDIGGKIGNSSSTVRQFGMDLNIHPLRFMKCMSKCNWDFSVLNQVGLAKLNATSTYTYNLSPEKPVTETYTGSHFYYQTGLRIQYRIERKYTIGLSATRTFVNSDNLDVVNNGGRDGFYSAKISFGYLIGCCGHCCKSSCKRPAGGSN